MRNKTRTNERGKEMTEQKIKEKQAKENTPYELAKAIRKMLDEAKANYKGNWNDDEVEVTVCELVFED